jgi:hypothetical protein
MSHIHKAWSEKLDEIDRLRARVRELESILSSVQRVITELELRIADLCILNEQHRSTTHEVNHTPNNRNHA